MYANVYNEQRKRCMHLYTTKGENVAKGVKNTLNNTAEGRYRDAAESAWEGTADAAREFGNSMKDTAQKVGDAMQNAFDTAMSRTEDATEDTIEGRPTDAIQSAFQSNSKNKGNH